MQTSIRKNIIFHIRLIDREFEGLSMDENWLNVYLENMKPPNEFLHFPFELGDILTFKFLMPIAMNMIPYLFRKINYGEE